jgi:hypothetical protein
MPWETVIATVFQAGNRVVINGAGLFVYAGAPTTGNLLFSISNADGTDQYGNTYYATATLYMGSEYLNLDVVPGVAPQISMVTGAVSEDEPATLFSDISNKGAANESMTSWLIGPSSSYDDLRALVQLNSSTANGATLANGVLALYSGNTQLSAPVTWNENTGQWVTMTSFLNGWTKTSGGPTCRYRLTAFNEVEVQGGINASGASASPFFQLPTGYRPTVQGMFQFQSTTVTDSGQFFGTCSTSGVLTANGNPSAGPNYLFQGTFPLN